MLQRCNFFFFFFFFRKEGDGNIATVAFFFFFFWQRKKKNKKATIVPSPSTSFVELQLICSTPYLFFVFVLFEEASLRYAATL